jgi:ankyrin repeat protein
VGHNSELVTRRSFGWTGLYSAAQNGHRDVIDYLVQHGAQTDIFVAVMLGDKDTVSQILDKEPDACNAVMTTNPAEDTGRTPLYYAAASGNEEIVELLLEKGASPNKLMWESPLEVARKNGHQQVVETLLKAGARK